MKGCTVGVTQPIAGIERQQLDLGAFRQLGGFIDDQAAAMDACREGHDHEIITMRPRPTRVAADAGTGARPAPLNPHVDMTSVVN